MAPPRHPYQPYADVHIQTAGPGDERPTADQIISDCGLANRLHGKTVLITGASGGVGAATARALYAAGARVLLTSRNISSLEQTIKEMVSKSPTATGAPRPVGIQMQLDSLASVKCAAAEIQRRCGGKLNIIINNAGVFEKAHGRTEDGFERHIGANHLGHFLLFMLLKDVLEQSAEESGTTSRIVNVSSPNHTLTGIHWEDIHWEKNKEPGRFNCFRVFGQSNTANMYMANAITRHYGAAGLTGLSVYPGMLGMEARKAEEEGHDQLDEEMRFAHGAKSFEQAAATAVWAAVSAHFEDVANGGRYLVNVGEAGPWGHSGSPSGVGYAVHAYDDAAEDELWRRSCLAVGLP